MNVYRYLIIIGFVIKKDKSSMNYSCKYRWRAQGKYLKCKGISVNWGKTVIKCNNERDEQL